MARRPPVAERVDQRSPVQQAIDRWLAEFAERGVNTVPLPADALAAIDRLRPEDATATLAAWHALVAALDEGKEASALHEIDQIIVRLDAGIAEERKEMGALLARLRTTRSAA